MTELPESTRAKIQSLVSSAPVVLFMKGNRRSPACGFSASVVELLDTWLDDYATVDVLADPEVREGVKQFSDWPTIPQLYVDGEFVGGADIVRELDQTGELREALGAPEVRPPTLTITEAAAEQFRAAFEGADIDDTDVLRLTVDAHFRNDLSIGSRRPGDLVVNTAGLELVVDAKTARRAQGLTIDFVETEQGAGFKIDNPNAPPEVRELAATELAARLAQARDSGETLHLYDVRQPHEYAIAKIEGAQLLDADLADAIEALPRDTPLYFHCHHGVRSLRAAQHFVELGFVEVYNLTGGIDAWSQHVDPAVPRY